MGRPPVDPLEDIARALLRELTSDPERPGLADTPRRWAKMWREFVDYDPGRCDTVFESVAADQVVMLRNVTVWSVCEHHLLPFRADMTMAYLPHADVLGISKLARIAHKYAHRLQLQERLVEQVATEIGEVAHSPDVAVMARGWHLCMQMRGIRSDGTMVTSVLRGAFRDVALRAEFFRLAGET